MPYENKGKIASMSQGAAEKASRHPEARRGAGEEPPSQLQKELALCTP